MTFYSWGSVWVRSALLLVPCLAPAACGGTPVFAVPIALAPHVVASVKSTHVTSYILDARVNVQFSKLNLQTGSTALLPTHVILGINEGVNSSRESEAAEQAAKFVDVDFRGQFWAAISPVVKETAWLKAGDMQPSTMPREPVTAATGARAGEGELAISTKHFITPEAQKLVVITGFHFYLPGWSGWTASNFIEYSSAAIGRYEADEAVKLWIADEGAAYKKAATESVVESAKMLRYALRGMGGDWPKPQRKLKVRLLNSSVIEAWIIEETEERILYHGKDGSFHSIAAEDIDFDGQPSLHAEKVRRDEEKTERGQVWKKWGTEHPGDPCVSAVASLKSASECVGAACRTPIILMAGYLKNCHPDSETRIDMHRFRHKWEKETGAGTPN
jgi:hypothetical protein